MFWTALGSIFTTAFNRWGQVSEAKHQAKMTKIKTQGEIDLQRVKHTASWQQTMAQATKNSWKDQLALVILLAPFVGVFIPPLAPFILTGFEILAQTPAWYQVMLGAAIMASFGIKVISRK